MSALFPFPTLYPVSPGQNLVAWSQQVSLMKFRMVAMLQLKRKKTKERQVADPATCTVQNQIRICLEFQENKVTPTEQASLPILKFCIFLIKYKPISSKCPPASSGESTCGGTSNGQRAAAFGVSVLPQQPCPALESPDAPEVKCLLKQANIQRCHKCHD